MPLPGMNAKGPKSPQRYDLSAFARLMLAAELQRKNEI
jgi:hypothetical protein